MKLEQTISILQFLYLRFMAENIGVETKKSPILSVLKTRILFTKGAKIKHTYFSKKHIFSSKFKFKEYLSLRIFASSRDIIFSELPLISFNL